MSDNKTVEQLLLDHGIAYKISGKDFVTTCFNPEHNDSNPSFRIDRFTGVSHCFSCGYKTNIFKFYNVGSNNHSVRVAKLKEKLRVLNENTNGLNTLEGTIPFNGVHRGISSQTLKEFGAFKTSKVSGMEDRIIFPILDIRDKVTAYVGRHVLPNGEPRYKTYPSGCVLQPYPSKFVERHYSIVLVEGIFDLLNVWDKGLKNVVCTFGTDGLQNNTAEKLLPYKIVGITKVFIMYDGDEPGQKAAEKLKPLIEEAGFIVEIINLPDDSDPGNLCQDDVNGIIEYTK